MTMFKTVGYFLSLIGISALLTGCWGGRVASSATATQPTQIGERIPTTPRLQRVDGVELTTGQALKGKSVIIFYRGGWCPYCNSHLKELNNIEKALHDLGFQIFAISPDKPAKLRETKIEHKLKYTMLSDSDMQLARMMGVAFELAPETLQKLESYEIDIHAASGRSHNLLPVPSVFLVDDQGIIRYAHSNPDYKVRLSARELLAAARQIK